MPEAARALDRLSWLRPERADGASLQLLSAELKPRALAHHENFCEAGEADRIRHDVERGVDPIGEPDVDLRAALQPFEQTGVFFL